MAQLLRVGQSGGRGFRSAFTLIEFDNNGLSPTTIVAGSNPFVEFENKKAGMGVYQLLGCREDGVPIRTDF